MYLQPTSVTISHLNKQGYGVVANPPEKIAKKLYVAGTLPGETVEFTMRATKHKARWGTVSKLTGKPSPQRVQPRCQYAAGYLSDESITSICGGCSLQHITYDEQLAFKHNGVQKLFAASNLAVAQWAKPLAGNPFGYRHQARIGVRWVITKNKLMLGFREIQSSRITDCHSCPVLIPQVGALFPQLAACIASLSIAAHIAQIEVCAGDEYAALIIRNLQAFSPDDLIKLSNFGKHHRLAIYTQCGGMDTISPLVLPDGFVLEYQLQGLHLNFEPGDFIQNNLDLNRAMVAQALDWLSPQSDETAIDLFCGIGNFSLPLAQQCRELVGVEGSINSVTRASANAKKNAVHNAVFYTNDLTHLYTPTQQAPVWWENNVDCALLDPPRSGAAALCEWLKKRVNSRLLYVSCNPDSLVADLLELRECFHIQRVGIVDMFANTAHCEVMCLLTKA